MRIPINDIKKFRRLREWGDLKRLEAISEQTGDRIARQTFAAALDKGRCNERTYSILKEYYSEIHQTVHAA